MGGIVAGGVVDAPASVRSASRGEGFGSFDEADGIDGSPQAANVTEAANTTRILEKSDRIILLLRNKLTDNAYRHYPTRSYTTVQEISS
jgi:hypothetical protein